jgi:hypothetical protein
MWRAKRLRSRTSSADGWNAPGRGATRGACRQARGTAGRLLSDAVARTSTVASVGRAGGAWRTVWGNLRAGGAARKRLPLSVAQV